MNRQRRRRLSPRGPFIPRQGLTFLAKTSNGLVDTIGESSRPVQKKWHLLGDGTGYLSNAAIAGTETVVSKGGTAAVTFEAGKINVGIGTLWSLILSNGSRYEYPTIINSTLAVMFDVSGIGRHLVLTGFTIASAVVSSFTTGSDWLNQMGYTVADGSQFLDVTGCTRVPNDVLIPSLTSGDYVCLYIASTSLVQVFTFDVISTQTISGNFRTSGTTDADQIYVDWGDGTTTIYKGTTDQAYSKSYASAVGVRNVRILAASAAVLTKFTMNVAGANIGGVLSMPSGMTYLQVTGANTFSGALTLPPAMTYFSCTGANTLSGSLSMPATLTSFRCEGSHTLSGSPTFHAGLVTFQVYGNNTLSGSLSLPSTMTFFACSGVNTLSGTLTTPPAMTYFWCTGSNTVSGYTSSAKASNQQTFYLVGQNTLTSAMVDQILIDLATAGGTWSSGNITIQGNAQDRTSASDAAITTLLGKGVTINVS